jgi:saccharopine dehydrogenase (NADP+, L-glutamate forming)
VAPESDDNPWHYKFSWNPRNVVNAGKSGAVYKENSKVKSKKYETLYSDCSEVIVESIGSLACYYNRDSLSYIQTYGLEEAETFMRTTLRYPDFCKGWDLIIQLGLTDELDIQDTDGVSVSTFLRNRFIEKNISFELLPVKQQEQFVFLGCNDDTMINNGRCSSADVLLFILEKKWALKPEDKDMIVMLHEIGYVVKSEKLKVKSSLVVKGEDSLRTAMAKTVGLPLGIAATLLLEGKIDETGLQIPIVKGIYKPVLKKLADFGIVFYEYRTEEQGTEEQGTDE